DAELMNELDKVLSRVEITIESSPATTWVANAERVSELAAWIARAWAWTGGPLVADEDKRTPTSEVAALIASVAKGMSKLAGRIAKSAETFSKSPSNQFRALREKSGRERWISAKDLRKRFKALADDQFDLAVAVAIDRGWVQGAGRPPHHLQL